MTTKHIIIPSKDIRGFKVHYTRTRNVIDNYTSLGIDDSVSMDSYVNNYDSTSGEYRPKLDWEYVDEEGHEHKWERDEDLVPYLTNSVSISEEGGTCYYCSDCEEELFPEYNAHPIVRASEVSFNYLGKRKIDLNTFIKITGIPDLGDACLRVQNMETQVYGDGSYNLTIRGSMILEDDTTW